MDAERPQDAARSEASLAAFTGAREADVWAALAAWRSEGRRFVLLTVVESRGFTPQKAGAHMLLAADGETVGTIGGGAIEHEALREAATLLASDKVACTVKKHLTQELGMCCGGEMVVYLEVLEAMPQLFVYGAGYLARPMAALAAGTGFRVTVVDARPEWAQPQRFPTAALRCQDPEDHARSLERTEADFVVVTTHDHALDQRLVQLLLAKPFRFVGMVGSLAKQRKFALRLRARGFTDEQIARMRTPLGLAIGAQTPEEIAVSVLAELIAVRRGGAPERGWVPRNRNLEDKAAEPQAPALERTTS
ncbi:MAG: xanthine dehydrogenase accessory protein XdhC [Candidatus Eisenbacteria bacterium]